MKENNLSVLLDTKTKTTLLKHWECRFCSCSALLKQCLKSVKAQLPPLPACLKAHFNCLVKQNDLLNFVPKRA